MKKSYLDWPKEICSRSDQYSWWHHPESNICLDFHGNPAQAELVVFSDGNHHMALGECLELFQKQNHSLGGIFYATTPPGPIQDMLKNKGLQMGNLSITATPHIFISPPKILDKLVKDKFLTEHIPFIKSQGNVLLVQKGNPKNILKPTDLIQREIRIFISNPDTEQASFSIYHATLNNLTADLVKDTDFLYEKVIQGEVLFGNCIHHREAPQAIAEGSADAAIVFYHLALRYLRVFPNTFEIIPLGGTVADPKPIEGNLISSSNIGLVRDGGKWGSNALSFLKSTNAVEIYAHHGLQSA